jgi:chromosome segregation ATPase
MKNITTILTSTDNTDYEVSVTHKDTNLISITATSTINQFDRYYDEIRADAHTFAFIKRAFSDADPGECTCTLERTSNTLSLRIDFPKFEISHHFNLDEDVQTKVAKQLKSHYADIENMRTDFEQHRKTSTQNYDSTLARIQAIQEDFAMQKAISEKHEYLLGQYRTEFESSAANLSSQILNEGEKRAIIEQNLVKLEEELERHKSMLHKHVQNTETENVRRQQEVDSFIRQIVHLREELSGNTESHDIMRNEIDLVRDDLNQQKTSSERQISSMSEQIDSILNQIVELREMERKQFPYEELRKHKSEIDTIRVELEQQKQSYMLELQQAKIERIEMLDTIRSLVQDLNYCKGIMEQQQDIINTKDQELKQSMSQIEALKLELAQLTKISMHSEQQLRSFVNHQTELAQRRFEEHDNKISKLGSALKQTQTELAYTTEQANKGLLRGIGIKL